MNLRSDQPGASDSDWNRKSSHVVQGRRNIPHQAHEKERYLQDGIRKEVHSAHQLVIPRHTIEVDEET